MNKIRHVYRLINLLSLDVAAGAVICTVFFSRLLHVQLKWSGLVTLGLTVWIIYTADHLLDARNVKHSASTERHRFHQINFRGLVVLLFVAVVIDGLFLFSIRRPVLIGGLVLGFIIAAYFFLQRYFKFLKEFFAAILYCGGVFLVPLSLNSDPLTTGHVILLFQFFTTALINLLLFSWFDYADDKKDHRQSLATYFGVNATRILLIILFVINAALMTISFLEYSILVYATLVLVMMNLLLLIILLKKRFFIVNDRYRLLGDAVFLLPFFYLVLVR
jgi:hypothetical protein